MAESENAWLITRRLCAWATLLIVLWVSWAVREVSKAWYAVDFCTFAERP